MLLKDQKDMMGGKVMMVICWMIVGILNSPMSQPGRKSGSSSQAEIAFQRLEIDTTVSDQERKQNVQLLLKVILTKRVI